MQLTRRELLQGTTALGLASVLPRAHARGSLTVLEFGAAYVEASMKLAEKWNGGAGEKSLRFGSSRLARDMLMG